MQFDLDELLVGIDHIPTFLSSLNNTYDAVYFHHYFPKDDIFEAASAAMINTTKMKVARIERRWLGKTLFRASAVNGAWTHFPTNPKELRTLTINPGKLPHYRRNNTRHVEHFKEKNLTWEQIDMPYHFIDFIHEELKLTS